MSSLSSSKGVDRTPEIADLSFTVPSLARPPPASLYPSPSLALYYCSLSGCSTLPVCTVSEAISQSSYLASLELPSLTAEGSLRTSSHWTDCLSHWADQRYCAEGYNGKGARLRQAVRLVAGIAHHGMVACPMAMTDGAVALIREALRKESDPAKKDKLAQAESKMRNGQARCGQWMTEKRGGSDVSSATMTIAVRQEGNNSDFENANWKLYGLKWFASAIDGDMAITLARNVNMVTGERDKRLTAYLVEIKNEEGNIKSEIQILKLKNKMGTRTVPTAEIVLNGVEAIRISEPGKGISCISTMLNITRLYNSYTAVSYCQWLIALSIDYSQKRRAFGKLIMDHPSHALSIASVSAKINVMTAGVLWAADLQDKYEEGSLTLGEAGLHKILIPLLKYFTAKQGNSIVSTIIEQIGSLAYMEESGVPEFQRNMQALSIWEGTSNILSLELLKLLQRMPTDMVNSINSWLMLQVDTFNDVYEAELRADKDLRNCYRMVVLRVADLAVYFEKANQKGRYNVTHST